MAKCKVSYINGRRYVDMGNRGLLHDIFCSTQCVIKAGTKHIKIAFRQSHLWRWDENEKCMVRMNVYLTPDGREYHA